MATEPTSAERPGGLTNWVAHNRSAFATILFGVALALVVFTLVNAVRYWRFTPPSAEEQAAAQADQPPLSPDQPPEAKKDAKLRLSRDDALLMAIWSGLLALGVAGVGFWM